MKAFNYLNWIVLLLTGAVAIGLEVVNTPIAFWLPAWGIQAAAFIYALMRRDGAHGPSTLLGCLAAAHITAVMVILSRTSMPFPGLAQIFFGLLFTYGLMYLYAARPSLIRRGVLRPARLDATPDPAAAPATPASAERL